MNPGTHHHHLQSRVDTVTKNYPILVILINQVEIREKMHAGKDANKTRASFFSIAGALESGKARHEK